MLTHVDAKGQPAMVNVGEKPVTHRTAHAVAVVSVPPELAGLFKDGEIRTKKGAVFQTSVLAGVMGAKRTGDLIPLCHPLALENCQIEIRPNASHREIIIHCRVETHARTGVEMEALTGATVAALALYDMSKAVSHEIVIREIRLISKTGGKRDYHVEDTTPDQSA